MSATRVTQMDQKQDQLIMEEVPKNCHQHQRLDGERKGGTSAASRTNWVRVLRSPRFVLPGSSGGPMTAPLA